MSIRSNHQQNSEHSTAEQPIHSAGIGTPRPHPTDHGPEALARGNGVYESYSHRQVPLADKLESLASQARTTPEESEIIAVLGVLRAGPNRAAVNWANEWVGKLNDRSPPSEPKPTPKTRQPTLGTARARFHRTMARATVPKPSHPVSA